MLKSSKNIFPFKDFSGGLVTKGSELSLQPNQSPDCLNVHSDVFKSLQKRQGYAKLNSATQGASCNGIYNYRQSDTAQYLVSLWGTGLYKMDVVTSAWDGTWDAITKDPYKGTTLADNIMYATTYEDDMIITSEGRSVPQMYNPADNANQVDLDWETSHASVTGDVTTYTGSATSKLKITIDGTYTFDAIDVSAATSIANVVTIINAFSGFAARGYAYADTTGYLVIISNTRGTASVVKVEDGTGDTQGTCGDLFALSITTGAVSFTGTGTNNLTVDGQDATCSVTTNYKVEIDGTATPNTFKWSDDGGSTWDATGVAITLTAQGLNNSVSVTIATSTGHISGDYWTFTITVQAYKQSKAIVATDIAPSGKYAITWTDILWIANTSANPDRLYYSSDHKDWTDYSWIDIITPGDVGITGMATIRGTMYVFKKNSIHRVTYYGGTPELEIKQVKSTTGTSSFGTIRNVEIPDQGEVLFFLGSDLQLYIYNGQDMVAISEGISAYNGISNYCLIDDGSASYGINSGQLIKCHAINYTKRHWYILWYCKDTDTTPKDALVYDYYAKSFFPFTFNSAFNASCISDNGAGQKRVYVGGTNYAWLYDTGSVDDTGVAINAYWTSSKIDLGAEVLTVSFRSLSLTTTSNATATPLFNFKTDWASSWSSNYTLSINTIEHIIDIPRFDELFQIKLSDNSVNTGFNILRATLLGDTRGFQR